MKQALIKLGISPNKADLIIQQGQEKMEEKAAERKAAREAKGNSGPFNMKALLKTPAQRASLKAAKLERLASLEQAQVEPTPEPTPKKSKKKKPE